MSPHPPITTASQSTPQRDPKSVPQRDLPGNFQRLPPEARERFQARLLGWYDAHARALPWRQQPSLYRTVVSEFMLQQTQVATVLPYFTRWLAAFPDFEALARADEATVLKLWEGLGYYNRARNLRRLAQTWVALPSAQRPATAEAWRKMPGVGPYTAAAIASIAHGEPVAVVDGNVVRVLARVSGETRAFTGNAAAVAAFRPLAVALIAGVERPGDYNQALMELGATVCRKAEPTCLLCPLRPLCESAADPVAAASIPRIERRRAVERTVSRLVCRSGGAVWLRQHGKARRLSGLWEFPEVPAPPAGAALLFEGRRGIANERIREYFYAVDPLPEVMADLSGGQWVPVADLDALAMTGPHRKWLPKILSALPKE